MTGELSGGKVSLSVHPDTTKFGEEVVAGVAAEEGRFSALGHKLGEKLMEGLGALGIVASVGEFFKKGFEEYAAADAIQAQFAAGIKSTGNAANLSVQGMDALAKSVAGYSGQSYDSIGKTEQVLQTFENIKNAGPDKIFDQATVAAANMAAKLGGDASASAIQLGKALNDPVKGMTALRRVGVSFTDDQTKMVKAMVANGDVLGAQKIILKELTTEFGGAAKAAGETLPGEVARSKVAFGELARTIVEGLAPFITPVIGKIADAMEGLGPVITHVSEVIHSALDTAFQKIAAGAGLVKDAIHGISTDGIDIGPLTVPLETVGRVLGSLWANAKTLWDNFKPLLSQFVDLAKAISPLMLVLKALEPSLPTIASGFGNLAGSLGGILEGALSQLLPPITKLSGIFATELSGAIIALLPLIMHLASGGLGFLTGFIQALVPPLVGLTNFMADNAKIVEIVLAGYVAYKIVTGIIDAVGLAKRAYAAATYGEVAATYAQGAAAKAGLVWYALTESTVWKSVAAWVASTAAQVANAEGGLLAKAAIIGTSVATGLATAAQWAWNAAVEANPIGLIILAIIALVAAIVWVATQTHFFQDAWQFMVTAVAVAWKWLHDAVIVPVAGFIVAVVSGIAGVFQTVSKAIGDALNWLNANVFVPLGQAVDTVFHAIAAVFQWIYQTIIVPVITVIILWVSLWAAIVIWLWTSVIQPYFNLIGTIISWLWNAVIAVIGAYIKTEIQLWGAVFTWLHDNVIAPVFALIGDLFTWLWNSVINPVVGFIEAAIQVWGDVITWLHDNIFAPLFAAIGNLFTWLWNTVIDVVVNYIKAAIQAWGATITWLHDNVVAPVFNAISALFSWIYNSIIVPIVNAIVAQVRVWGAIFTWVRDSVITPAIQGIGSIITWLRDNVVNPVIAGISATVKGMGDAWNWVWNNVIRPVGDSISGAVKTIGDTVGRVFGGMGDTIKGGFSGVVDFVRGIFNHIIDLVNGVIGGVNNIAGPLGSALGLNVSLGKLPHLATGGSILQTGLALVGEQGPEIVKLPAGAQVYPHGSGPADQSSGGGTSIVNNFNGPMGLDAEEVAEKVTLRQRRAQQRAGGVPRAAFG